MFNRFKVVLNSKARSLFVLRRVRSRRADLSVRIFVVMKQQSAIAIPVLGIGTILIIVGLTSIINWKDITGTIKEVGNVAVNWASDTVSDVTNRIINRFNNAGVAAPNIFERLRGTIEDVVRNVFAARRGNTPGNNQAQNKQAKDAIREI